MEQIGKQVCKLGLEIVANPHKNQAVTNCRINAIVTINICEVQAFRDKVFIIWQSVDILLH